MKTFLLVAAFVTSFGASAQVYVNPNIFNFGNSVQIQIYNTNDFDISCSGSVNIFTHQNRMESGYYFEQIRKGSLSIRNFYLMDMNNRVNFTSHSIFCQKVR
jgi:hypothetical protein